MDVAAFSMDMSMAKLQQNAGLSIAKKAMNQEEQQAAGLLDMVSQANPGQFPHSGVGQNIDTRA
jgi:hypothetical protein